MTKTEGERLAILETKVDDIKESMVDLKNSFCQFVESADSKYATKSEMSSLRKLVWFMVGGGATFLVWVLQEYLRTLK